MKLANDAAFPKSKLCRTLPYDLRFGAKETLGLGLDDIYISQGLDKVIFYLEEINNSSMSSPLLRTNMEWAIIHLGTGKIYLTFTTLNIAT